MRANRLLKEPRYGHITPSVMATMLPTIVCFAMLLSPPAHPKADDLTARQAPKERQRYDVPYRLSETLHILVRAKFNGQGPFTLIVDTGAPMLVLNTEVALKTGVQTDAGGWAKFALMELEGGPKLRKVRALVEDIFQLRGINALGLAGTKVHGVLGYTVLARYRMEFDLSRDTMVWTELDYVPAEPIALLGRTGQRPRTAPPELEAVGSIMQFVGNVLGRQAERPLGVRGFLGIELSEKDGQPTVKAVLPGSPAEKAGFQVGDLIVALSDRPVKSTAELQKLASRTQPGGQLVFSVERTGQRTGLEKLTVTAGRGF